MRTVFSKMKKIEWIMLSGFLFLAFSVTGQNFSVSEVYFSTAFTWEYENSIVPEGDSVIEGKFTAYYDVENGFWAVFNPDIGGASGMMANWVVLKPDGTVITEWMGESFHEKPCSRKQK